jgi:hypothetical protein
MLINGIHWSWQSVEIAANGIVLPGVKSMNYKDSMTPGKVRGTSAIWLGYTDGQYEADADMEVFRTQDEAFKLALGGIGFMQRRMVVTVTYFHPELPPVVDTIVARIMGNEVGLSDSPDAAAVKHPLCVLAPILWTWISCSFTQ